MKYKRLTNRSNFITVMDAISAIGFDVKIDVIGSKRGFSLSKNRASETNPNHDVWEHHFVERKDIIEWINFELECRSLIPREEPEP